MTDERGSTSRRSLLRRLPAALGGAALAGCATLSGGGGSTPTPLTSTCSDGRTGAPDLYDDWLVRFDPGEYSASRLAVAAMSPWALARFPRIESLAAPYLTFLKLQLDRAALEFAPLDRVLFARPPGSETAAFFVVRHPVRAVERKAWLQRLGMNTYVTQLSDYRSYTRRTVDYDSIRHIAFDDEHVLVVPKSGGPIDVDIETRLERLVATRTGDEHPYHCYHPDARRLFERLPPSDLAYAWLRTDDERFGGSPRVPAGARASAFRMRLRWPDRRRGPRTPRSVAPTPTDAAATPTNSPGGATPSATPTDGGDTATPSATPTAALTEPVVDLGLVTVFPEGNVDETAVREHVTAHRTNTAQGRGGLVFDDPTFAVAGRTVTVAETRPVAALVA